MYGKGYEMQTRLCFATSIVRNVKIACQNPNNQLAKTVQSTSIAVANTSIHVKGGYKNPELNETKRSVIFRLLTKKFQFRVRNT